MACVFRMKKIGILDLFAIAEQQRNGLVMRLMRLSARNAVAVSYDFDHLTDGAKIQQKPVWETLLVARARRSDP